MINTPTSLSSRERFRLMLQQFPLLAHYWNTEENCLREQDMKQDLGVLRRGEQIMARFYLSVWSADNYDFDFLDAAGLLDTSAKRVIMTWFADPFWP